MTAPTATCWGCNQPATVVSIVLVNDSDPHIIAAYLCDTHNRPARDVQQRNSVCGDVTHPHRRAIVADLPEVAQ